MGLQSHPKAPRPLNSRIIVLVSALLHAFAGAGWGQVPTLKEAFKDHFQVGAAVNRSLVTGTPGRRNLELFISKAFEYAHEADPDAILRYNDYGLENPVKRAKLIHLIKSLQAQKVPVHAIGSQTHVNTSITFETMDQALKEIETLGLPIHITEFDVNGSRGGQRGFGADISANANATQGGLVADADQKLADAYAGIFRAFLKHSAVKLVTFWGLNDALSWRAAGKPLLFDANDQPKPAFKAVIGEAKSESVAK
ncbi:MAG: Endo,4-beta-xylanase/feruloyl esterase precursor [Verrucomicrobiales bacterium]|nr:Endo,4-beta-xylanase/feruloyl esterase precursor [Verrucomicrobiales bacterium]